MDDQKTGTAELGDLGVWHVMRIDNRNGLDVLTVEIVDPSDGKVITGYALTAKELIGLLMRGKLE